MWQTPAVVLTSGIMAAGKSTVAELPARRLPRAVHLRGDLFRRMGVSGRADMPAQTVDEILARAWTDGRIG
ncbi:MAG: hypothetical protein WA890_05605 [Micromonospora sp.]